MAVLTLDPLSVRERLQQAQMTPETLLERVFAPAARTAGNGAGPTSDLAEWLLHGGFPRLYGIEVKATATPTAQHGSAIKRWLALAGPDTRGALACNVDRPQALLPDIKAIPWHLGG